MAAAAKTNHIQYFCINDLLPGTGTGVGVGVGVGQPEPTQGQLGPTQGQLGPEQGLGSGVGPGGTTSLSGLRMSEYRPASVIEKDHQNPSNTPSAFTRSNFRVVHSHISVLLAFARQKSFSTFITPISEAKFVLSM